MIPTDFRIDPADYTADFQDLRSVRETVFVLEQNVPIEEEWDELDPRCHHVIARDANGQPIGTGRLTPEHKIGRMAVLKAWRNKGVGDALMVALMNQARSLGWTEVSLNAQVSAEAFYARHGFQPYGERFMEAGIEHQAMRRALEPLAGPERYPARPREASVPSTEFDGLSAATEATPSAMPMPRLKTRAISSQAMPPRDWMVDGAILRGVKKPKDCKLFGKVWRAMFWIIRRLSGASGYSISPAVPG